MSENNKIEEVANYDILYNVINTDPEKVMNIRIIDNDHPCTLYIGYKLDNNCSFFDEKANKDFLKNKEVYYLYSSEIDKRSYLAPMIMGTDYNEEYPVPGYSFVGTVIYHKDLKFINTINNYGNVSSMVQDYGFPQYDYLRYGGGTGIKYPYYSKYLQPILTIISLVLSIIMILLINIGISTIIKIRNIKMIRSKN